MVRPLLSQSQRYQIFDKVLALIERKHFSPSFARSSDWSVALDQIRERIGNPLSEEDFEDHLNSALAHLGTSHTLLFHSDAKRVQDRYAICATFMSAGAQWMFQDVFEGGPAHAAGMEPGDLLLAVNGHPVVPPTKLYFRMGEPNTLKVEKKDGAQITTDVQIPQPRYRRHRPMCLPKLISCQRIGPDIGVIRVTFFRGPFGLHISRQLDTAIQELADCRRLIVDLRGNYGGGVGCFRLAGYFTPESVPVGYSLSRTLLRRGKTYDKQTFSRYTKIPATRWEVVRTVLRYAQADKSIVYMTEGLGPRHFHGRMVLLVNEYTSSAAEIVAGFVSRNRLAPVVGIKTAGELLGGFTFKVGNGYFLRLPTGAFCLWEGDEVLDGKGVTPDVIEPCCPDALRAGVDNQLEKAVELVRGL